MNIGIDARLWYESGVGRYIRNLVTGLDQKKKSDYIFTIFLNSKAYDLVHFESQNFRKVKSEVAWHTIAEQIQFKKELDREHLDLVHFPYFSYPIFYRKPFVITIHDLIIDHYPTGMASSLPLPFYYAKHFAYKKIVKSAVRNAKKIIVPSHATKEELISLYKAKTTKIEVIYEGFDPMISENSVKEKLVSKNFILYVGNAYPHKNLKNLLEAYRRLREKTQIDLVCIGRDDFFYKRLEKNQEGVHFLHSIDDSTLFSYYTNARLLVVPSLMEGFGLPLLEGMSLSCPVVSSNTSALKEIGGEAALYFDPNEPDDIVRAIEKVLNEPNISRELKRKGLMRSEKFSWEKCIDNTLEVYESSVGLRQSK